MQPPTSSNNISPTTRSNIHLSQEHRTRLQAVIYQMDDEQLRTLIVNYFRPFGRTDLTNRIASVGRAQLIQQSFALIDNYYAVELEHMIYSVLQKRFNVEYRAATSFTQPPSVQQQQQQRPVSSTSIPTQHQQQTQQINQIHTHNYQNRPNSAPYFYPPQTVQFGAGTNYGTSGQQNVRQQQIRPRINNHNTAVPTSTNNQPCNNIRPVQSQNFFTGTTGAPQYGIQANQPIAHSNRPVITAPINNPRYPVSTLTPIVSAASIRLATPPINTTQNIKHKTLPFFRPLACVFESYQAFRYDSQRKQYMGRHEFLLSVDTCNQLALSSDYDPDLDVYKTSKCLILRLVRLDQPPMSDGKYNDHLPPNLCMQVNGIAVTNLPTPKPCTRQQADLIRVGREVDITMNAMYNPMLPNEVTMNWSCRPENTALNAQYANAQFAIHIFLVQHMTVDDLCEHVKQKPSRFVRDDLAKIVETAQEKDRELGLEVSDQILKLKCPIDQRRLRMPVRATTCYHLQCFDLRNYTTLNEKAGKWICPVCNKPALYDDLQIDSYIESVLNSINNETITDITIDSNLNWTPISTINPTSNPTITNSDQKSQRPVTSQMRDIVLDDDDNQNGHDLEDPVDTKFHIPLIKTQPHEPGDFILIDDD